MPLHSNFLSWGHREQDAPTITIKDLHKDSEVRQELYRKHQICKKAQQDVGLFYCLYLQIRLYGFSSRYFLTFSIRSSLNFGDFATLFVAPRLIYKSLVISIAVEIFSDIESSVSISISPLLGR